jgi:mono/diheme cytochrome c family protein
MDYPFWNPGTSYAYLMAGIAILHVFVSQFAIGGGLYLVVTEHRMRRRGDAGGLEYLEDLTKVFVLVTIVFGTLSGVGIWFVIGLLNPAATEVLIHNFVWGWAIEWTFFIVEIAAAIFYYYSFRTMPAKTHLAIGWIYFAAAWLSLAVINGILSFMLTPGKWITTGSFWDGILNPTYLSTTVFRTGICLLLAGLYTLLVASRLPKGELKSHLVRWNAGWGLLGLVVMAPSFYWFYHGLPPKLLSEALARLPTPVHAMYASFAFAGALALLLLVLGVFLSRRLVTVSAVVLMLAGLGYVGAFEWFRESVRKPWIIAGYMYGNGIVVGDAPEIQKTGYLPLMVYRTGDDGADLFRHACQTCHTIDGYHGLSKRFAHTDAPFAAALIRGVGVMRAHMPPFVGTDAESEALAGYIRARVDTTPLDEATGLSGVALGEKVFALRCGTCHEFGGYKDLSDTLAGSGAEDIDYLLDIASGLDPKMPEFTGNAAERAALIEYILSVEKGPAPDQAARMASPHDRPGNRSGNEKGGAS